MPIKCGFPHKLCLIAKAAAGRRGGAGAAAHADISRANTPSPRREKNYAPYAFIEVSSGG